MWPSYSWVNYHEREYAVNIAYSERPAWKHCITMGIKGTSEDCSSYALRSWGCTCHLVEHKLLHNFKMNISIKNNDVAVIFNRDYVQLGRHALESNRNGKSLAVIFNRDTPKLWNMIFYPLNFQNRTNTPPKAVLDDSFATITWFYPFSFFVILA